MEIQELQYTKDWKNVEDFPTYESNETQVREDQQLLFDEVRDYLNDVLSPAVEEETNDIRAKYATKDELDDTVSGISPDLKKTEEVLGAL